MGQSQSSAPADNAPSMVSAPLPGTSKSMIGSGGPGMRKQHMPVETGPITPDAELLAHQARIDAGIPYEYSRLELPKDEEGYVVAFDVTQEAEIKEFFDKYGLVVVRNVMSAEDAARSLDEVWTTVIQANGTEVDRNDPRTWGPNPENPRNRWPWGGHLGILGNALLMNPQAFRNRENPHIHKVFSTIFGTPKLWVSVDRSGMMRPTKNIKMLDGSVVDRDEWRSKPDWLHLDMNPWTRRVSTYGWGPVVNWNDDRTTGSEVLKVQGILAMVDCSQNEGGLHVVPGFHKHILGWTKVYKERCVGSDNTPDPTTVQIALEDPIRADVQKAPIRRGSLLVWDSRIPHGTYQNYSSNFRAIQYIKMGLTTDRAIQPAGADIRPDELPAEYQMTELGAKLLGYQSWDS